MGLNNNPRGEFYEGNLTKLTKFRENGKKNFKNKRIKTNQTK